MKQTFEQVFEEVKASVSKTSTGKPVRSFSRADWDKLAKAYLNDPHYTVKAASVKGGELVTKEIEPVKAIRTMIYKVLVDFGVDKQEAERVLDTYEFRSVEGVYELASELVYRYMEAGKKFDFITREDFSGSLTVKEVEESVSTHKNIRTKEEFKVKKKQHKVLEKQSKAPSWLKSRA